MIALNQGREKEINSSSTLQKDVQHVSFGKTKQTRLQILT